MKIGHYSLNPALRSVILATLIVLILTSLGFWQVSRLNEKRAIEKQINEKNIAEVIDLNSVSLINAADYKYRKVKARGRFINKGITYIDNIPFDGKYGFYVYVPFLVEDNNKSVLVNFGWIPYQGSRSELPDVKIPEGTQFIEGSIRIPSKRPFVASSVERLDVDNKNLWLYMDLEKYSKEAPFQIYPFVIYLDPETDSGFVREWPVFNPKSAMHTGYAIMWFSLALIALFFFMFGNLRKNGEEENGR